MMDLWLSLLLVDRNAIIMKILISVGPIIGVLVIVFYTKGIQIYAHVKGEKKQDSNMKEIDITNMDAVLDLAGFEPGRITFTVVNEEAKNVKFQMKW